MSADIDQRTAALLLRVQEHAPGGDRSSADGVGLRVVDLSQVAALTGSLQILGVSPVAVLVTDGENLSCLSGGLDHGLGLRVSLCHGLFTHDMLARPQGGDGHRRVGAVGGQYIHHIQLFPDQLLIIGIDPGILRSVLRFRLDGPLLDQITESHDLKVSVFLHGGQMFGVGDAAASYDTGF